jgi:hypothetical protein
MGRITVSEGLERLRKWATRNAELLVIDADINNNAPGETLARIAVTPGLCTECDRAPHLTQCD